MNNQKIEAFLKLSKSESKLYTYLKKSPFSQVATISKDLKIPRMSVYLILKSLKQRGIADYNHKGKRKFWSAVSNSDFVKDMMKSLSTLNDSKEIRIEANNSGFAVHQGTEAMYKVWKDLEKLAPNSR